MSSFFRRSRSSGNLNSSSSPSTLSSSSIPLLNPAAANGNPGTAGETPWPGPSPQKASGADAKGAYAGSLGRREGTAFLAVQSRMPSQTNLKSSKSAKGVSAAGNYPSSPSSAARPSADASSSTAVCETSSLRMSDEAAEELPTQMTGKQWKPRPGHPGNLSPSQAAALLELTGRLSADNTLPKESIFPAKELEVPLCRFLRARGWNVQQAREMWNKSVEWKKSIELEKLLTDFEFVERDKVAKAGWQMYFHKTDKLGRPIFVQDLAGLDPNVVWTVTTPDRIIQNFAVTLENAVRYRYRACTEADKSQGGRLIEDNLMILDVNGLGMGTFWNFKAQLQQLLLVLDNNFPELSGRVQIINAPWLFSTIWSYLKGWLPPNTVDKIDIAGSDYQAKLLQFIDRDQLPRWLGGSCECSQHGGCHVSDAGPWAFKQRSSAEPVQLSKHQAASLESTVAAAAS